jgi:arogenate dehydrogenase (NADP+)
VLAFEDVLRSTPAAGLAGKLVVDVCSVKRHPKKLFLDLLPQNSDILCTHPIFGPDSARHSWLGLPMMYDRLRVADPSRCAQFLSIFERERCNMIEMPCELHDKYSASSQFTSHLIGRMCSTQGFQQTPIDSVGVQSMFRLIDTTSKDSFDLFYSLFKFNEHSYEQLAKMRDTLAALERQLAAKEAYLAAKAELGSGERAGVLAEVRSLMAEAASGGAGGE